MEETVFASAWVGGAHIVLRFPFNLFDLQNLPGWEKVGFVHWIAIPWFADAEQLSALYGELRKALLSS